MKNDDLDHATMAREQQAGNFAFVATAIVFVGSVISYVYLKFTLGPGNLALFPEHVSNFKIIDPTAQKSAYFVGVGFLVLFCLLSATAIASRFPDILQLRRPHGGLLERYYQSPARNWLEDFFEKARLPAWSIAIVLLIAIAVAYYFSEYASPVLFPQGDPHIFYVGGELANALVNNLSITPDMMTAYGVGPALIYAVAETALGSLSQYDFYMLARVSNILMVASFFYLCARVIRLEGNSRFSAPMMWAAVGVCAGLLGPFNSTLVTMPNLSALRYLPFLGLFLFLALSQKQGNGNLRLNVLGTASLGALLPLFPDSGTFALLGWLLYVATSQQASLIQAMRSLGYLALSLISAVAVSALLVWFTGHPLHLIFVETVLRFGKNLGGAPISVDTPFFVLVIFAVFTSLYIAYIGFRKNLDQIERLSLSLSACFLLSLMYYVNRPSSLYWIFGLLIVIPIHCMFLKAMRFGSFRAAQICFICCYVAIIDISAGQWKISHRSTSKHIDFSDPAYASGLLVRKDIAQPYNERLKDLSDMDYAHDGATVFTTTPMAVLELGISDLKAREIVFKTNTPSSLQEILAHLGNEKPNSILMEQDWSSAYAGPTAKISKQRISSGISDRYSLVCESKWWRVYRSKELSLSADIAC
ncbi:hypothetical protein [Ahrensia sp. R2A130]|uniref:hypothetical protein n=1 Tax=Ahrensia sp. R2A130 TaxID=744979 RepID=UPI0001E0B4F2|nr:hypothetical protein [Ahrensia sp. R2A130]EFL88478.1 putative membrane protein [Ahrensia sp. R2A130]